MMARSRTARKSAALALSVVGVACAHPPTTVEATAVAASPALAVNAVDSTSAHEATPAHESFTIASSIMHETRRINVYRPPAARRSRSAISVIYMPDGGLAEDFPHVATDIDRAIAAHDMQPVMLVGIENTERRRDMTGPTRVKSDSAIAAHVGGSAAFRAFIRDELMPVIAHRYGRARTTGIIGESLAGLFVMETLFADPDLFDVYISLSPSLWWNDQSLLRSAESRLRAAPSIRARLHFATAGDDDVGNAGASLAAVFRTAAPRTLVWTYEPRPDLLHSTIYRGASPALLRRLFPPVR